MRKKWALHSTILALIGLLSACNHPTTERVITILATNDIHGGIEPQNGLGPTDLTGGLAFFSGAVKSIKLGLNEKYGNNAGVLVLDAGDQFQGTLISNFTEGSLVFAAMNDAGYDAAVTGNHDYDFGPHGWLVDSPKDVNPNDSNADKDPRGVIKSLAEQANFPLLSANTYYKNSIVDTSGHNVDVSSQGCVPAVGNTRIDWSSAKHPEFLKPYLIKSVAGVRVAIIGIDTPETPTTTTPDDVTDLCFRDERDAYLDVRSQLEGKADIFVLVLHDGDVDHQTGASDLTNALAEAYSGSVDAVISGHTHAVYSKNIQGIPLIQSGSGGDRFGRIDFVYNMVTHTLERDKTSVVAGAYMNYTSCDNKIQSFCRLKPALDGVEYEGIPVDIDQDIVSKIADVRKQIAPLSSRIIGQAEGDLKIDRISESPLADALTDAFRAASNAEVAIMNTGGIRKPLKSGPITYEDFFQVLPFNNHGYVVGPMPTSKLLALLTRSVKTCGSYGALMQSGLNVTYTRNCTRSATDPKAHLLHVETLSGEVILDRNSGFQAEDSRVFNVATLDFLAEGGSGYSDFIGTPKVSDMGVLREVLSNTLVKSPAQWSATMDGRWTLAP